MLGDDFTELARVPDDEEEEDEAVIQQVQPLELEECEDDNGWDHGKWVQQATEQAPQARYKTRERRSSGGGGHWYKDIVAAEGNEEEEEERRDRRGRRQAAPDDGEEDRWERRGRRKSAQDEAEEEGSKTRRGSPHRGQGQSLVVEEVEWGEVPEMTARRSTRRGKKKQHRGSAHEDKEGPPEREPTAERTW